MARDGFLKNFSETQLYIQAKEIYSSKGAFSLRNHGFLGGSLQPVRDAVDMWAAATNKLLF